MFLIVLVLKILTYYLLILFVMGFRCYEFKIEINYNVFRMNETYYGI